MADVEDFEMYPVQEEKVEKEEKVGRKSKSKRKTKVPVKRTAGKKVKKDGTPYKPRRFKPGTVALREIRKYQKSGELLLPRLPMQRLIREVTQEFTDEGLRFQADAIEAVHCAAEPFLIEVLGKANRNAIAEGRLTLDRKDLVTLARNQMGSGFEAKILREAMRISDY